MKIFKKRQKSATFSWIFGWNLRIYILVHDLEVRNTWQADFHTLPPGIHQKPPKQPFESYRKSVSKIFKRKFYFLVVFHVKSVYAQEICVFEAFLRHFHFSTIIDNFSTFWCWYLQPRKHFRKVENLRVYRPIFDSKKCFFYIFRNVIFWKVLKGFFILM